MLTKIIACALKYYKKDPSDLKNLDMLIIALNKTNREEEFQKYINKWFKLEGKPHALVTFPEDNDEYLSEILDKITEMIDNHPELIVRPEPDLIKLADSLVEGIKINNLGGYYEKDKQTGTPI